MYIFCGIVALLAVLSGCVSEGRRLSQEEMQRNGLNGVLHDAPYCPTKLNTKQTGLVVVGKCETVTCLPDAAGKIDCRAK
jgi:hypothetical protein